MLRRILPFLLIALGLAWALVTLFGRERRPQETLTVMAGSELEDMEPLLPDIEKATGVALTLDYTGTLDGVDRLARGEQADLAWFSHAKYLTLVDPERIVAQEKIMLSPVVLGVKEDLARAWGWLDNPQLTWQDIAAKAASGELRYAMTNPTASNSGFTALMGVVAALAGSAESTQNGGAPQLSAANLEALQGFFRGQTLTSGSSGWLAESYVREQANLDGLVNYESVLLGLNASGELSEPLTLLYPAEGIVTADYPLVLLNPDKREAFDKLVAYLRTPEVQERIMNETLRRPAVPNVSLSDAFPDNLLVELPFPGTLEAVDNILFAYLNEIRVPSHAIFVLDVSGSMEGERLESLKTALRNLTGLDNSLTGQFATFSEREQITLIPFSSTVEDTAEFDLGTGEKRSAQLTTIRTYVNGLTTLGGTAIFSALEAAYRVAEAAQAREPDRYYSVVLMTDGENNEGIDERAFLDFYHALSENAQGIRTFPIVFGEADRGSLETLAAETGGRLFDGRDSSLSAIFKQIRGYQ